MSGHSVHSEALDEMGEAQLKKAMEFLTRRQDANDPIEIAVGLPLVLLAGGIAAGRPFEGALAGAAAMAATDNGVREGVISVVRDGVELLRYRLRTPSS